MTSESHSSEGRNLEDVSSKLKETPVRRRDFADVIAAYIERRRPGNQSFAVIVSKAMDTAARKVRIDINGQSFLLSQSACERIPALQNLLKAYSSRHKKQVLTPVGPAGRRGSTKNSRNFIDLSFDRNASVFSAIVEYVHNEELHVPKDVCPQIFARDLNFWGFSIQEVQPCCFSELANYLVSQEKLKEFQWFLYHKDKDEATLLKEESCSYNRSKNATLRGRLWTILDDPFACRASKIYFNIMWVFILLSFIATAASTTSIFAHTSSGNNGSNTSLSTSNSTRYQHSPKSNAKFFVEILEHVCSAYLIMDYFLRFIFFPHPHHFFRDVVNIFDGLAVLALLGKIVADKFMESGSPWIPAINVMQLLRLLRFLRPMSRLTWFRLLYFTLRCSYYELLLVITMLLFLAIFFSALLYYLGGMNSFNSLFEAIWYSLITMTTVGFGDVVPKTFLGKLIGSVVAVFGIIVMTMTSPIMVSNFHTLYINAIVGQPSTIKKVHNQLLTAIPATSGDSDGLFPLDGVGSRRSTSRSLTRSSKRISTPNRAWYPSRRCGILDYDNLNVVTEDCNPSTHNSDLGLAFQSTLNNFTQPPQTVIPDAVPGHRENIQPAVHEDDISVLISSPEGVSEQFPVSVRQVRPMVTSSAEHADRDTDTATTTGDEAQAQHGDDFNQNMLRRNRALLRTRYRSWYANYDSSDTDSTDTEREAGREQVDFMDFRPPCANVCQKCRHRNKRLSAAVLRRKR